MQGGSMRQIQISDNQAGQRFDKLLLKYLNKSSKGFIYKMLRKKNITLNGKKATGNELLQVGDEVKLFLAEETLQKFSQTIDYGVAKELDIVYEDDDILILNKPIGVLSQKAEKVDVSINEMAISYLLESSQLAEEELQTFRPSICNRLDRNTSGLIVVGKSLLGSQEMARLFKERGLRKYYLSVVKGNVSESKHIQGYLVKTKENKVQIHTEKSENADYIETQYKPLYTNGEYTVLQVHLITGKTHQIRASLASCGYPIIGDYKYGQGHINAYFKEKYNLKSQCLHAYQLQVISETRLKKFVQGSEAKALPPKIFQMIIGDITDGNMEF